MNMESFTKQYYDLLVGEYKGINLTRITDFDEFESKQIIDSIEAYNQSKVFSSSINSKKILIDIGFGGGFPILPLAKLLPETKFIGVETRNKKVKVVGEIAQKLNLQNVDLIHSRIENLMIDMDAVCTFKAVGKVKDFLDRINTNKTIEVFFYKGPNFYELEKDQLEAVKEEWDIIEEIELNVPDTDRRFLIGFRNRSNPHGNTGMNTLPKISKFLS